MAKKKTIACDRCGARFDHIPEKCPECGEIIYDRMDPHIRKRIIEEMGKRPLVKLVFIILGVVVLTFILCSIVMFLITNQSCCSGNSIGTLSAVRSAQGMYHSKYNTYGSFGDLYNNKYLEAETFNVGNNTAYQYYYTFTITVTSSNSWSCVGIPDDSNAKWVMIDETGSISWSEDNGKTWTAFGSGS